MKTGATACGCPRAIAAGQNSIAEKDDMTEVQQESAVGALGKALKDVRQTAYVSPTGELAAARLQRTLEVGPYEVIGAADAAFDVIDDSSETKIDEVHLKIWFAMDRTLEIIEPVRDASKVFNIDGLKEGELRFHHVAALVPDLGPCLQGARENGLPVFRIRSAVVDVAFIDLAPTGGPWLEVLRVKN